MTLIDVLFRPSQPSAQEGSTDAKEEAGRILAAGVTSNVNKADHAYLAQLVAARTGLSVADAATRVDQVVAQEKQAVAQAKQAADAARKAASSFAIYTFFSRCWSERSSLASPPRSAGGSATRSEGLSKP